MLTALLIFAGLAIYCAWMWNATLQDAKIIRHTTLKEVHDHWEFKAENEIQFDEWLHNKIKETEE